MIVYNPVFKKEIIDKAIEHANKEFPNESCGAVINETYVPYSNMSTDSENSFVISNKEFDKHYLNGNVKAIIHSHNSKAWASSLDQIKCDDMEVAFGIINLIEPELISHIIFWGKGIPKAPYVGRPFFFGVFDCLQLVCDYYKDKFKIKLPNPPRDVDFINNQHKFFEEYLQELNDKFEVRDLDGLEKDDILFYCHAGRVIHVGIYMDDNRVLHHWLNRRSGHFILDYKKDMLKFSMRLK